MPRTISTTRSPLPSSATCMATPFTSIRLPGSLYRDRSSTRGTLLSLGNGPANSSPAFANAASRAAPSDPAASANALRT
ncbi:hypothetical protein [Actinospica robiniae]|uniref:hypothetical protein n=1 Tax=Actinospica robiniae TaxID=304901 RepID=UPI00054CFADA|nr:hypothetical protein [Actinospica robiniae]